MAKNNFPRPAFPRRNSATFNFLSSPDSSLKNLFLKTVTAKNYLARNSLHQISMLICAYTLCACTLTSCIGQIPGSSPGIRNDLSQERGVSPQHLGQDSATIPAASPYGQVLPPLGSLSGVKGHNSQIIGIFPLQEPSYGQSKRVITVDESGQVLVWDLEQNRAYSLFKIQGPVTKAAISADGTLLAIATADRLALISPFDGSEKYVLNRLDARILSLDFHPAGASILVGGADGRVYRWKFEQESNASTLREKELAFERYSGPSASVAAVAFHPRGRVILSGDFDGGLSAWLTYDSDAYSGSYDNSAFGPKFFAEASSRVNGERTSTETIEKISFDRKGEFFALARQDGFMEVWRVRGFVKLSELKIHQGLVFDLAIGTDSRGEAKYISSCGRDGKVKIWQIKGEVAPEDPDAAPTFAVELLQEFPVPLVRRVAFVGELKLLAGDGQGRVHELDFSTVTNPATGADRSADKKT